jgi:hypothetical protein
LGYSTKDHHSIALFNNQKNGGIFRQIINHKSQIFKSKEWQPDFVNPAEIFTTMTKNEIARIKKFFNKKNTLPVLDTCLVKNGTITVSDLEYSGQFLTDVKGTGLITISELERPYDEAWIKDGALHVKRGTSVSISIAYEIDDYPGITFDPKPEKTDGKKYFFNDTAKLLKLQPFLGKEELRPAMTGFGFSNGKFYSTDAHRLGWEDFSEKTSLPDGILPAKTAVLLADKDYDVYFYENTNFVFHSTDGTEKLCIRAIDGYYPNVPAVIPEFNPFTVKIDTAILLNEIENANANADKTRKQIQFIFEKNTLTLTSEDLDYKKSYRNTVETMTETLIKFNIGFNGAFLKTIIDKKIPVTTMEFSAPNRATIINENRLMMPVMLDVVHFSENYANDILKYFAEQFATDQDACLSELSSHVATLNESQKKGYTDKLKGLILNADLMMKAKDTKPEDIPALQTRKEIHQKFIEIFQQPRNINEKVIFCTIPKATEQPKPSIQVKSKMVENSVKPKTTKQPQTSENIGQLETPIANSQQPTANSQEPIAETVFIKENYTPKSFIVFGAIDDISEELAKCGTFARNLRVTPSLKVDGFWCSNKRLEKVMQILANA